MHITSGLSIDSITSQISKLHEALKHRLDKTETIVFCILGDIVDKGDPTVFAKALIVLNYMKELFSEFNPRFEFTPGNHDLCNCPHNPIPEICTEEKCGLTQYYSFIRSFDSSYNPEENISHRKYDDVDLILANSISHKNCKYGQIDMEGLKNIVIDKPTILVTHHAFFSESDTDSAPIRNAYKIFELIEAKDIVGVLHGHTHGYKNIKLGNQCPIVGVGPFLKDIPNINHQVNLVSITPSGIYQVANYYYRKDLNKYNEDIVYKSTEKAYFGSSVKNVYEKVLHDTKKFGILPGMHLKLEMPYMDFKAEIEQCFSEHIPMALAWQKTSEVPDSLYYNHGQYMQSNSTTAIKFITEELKSKATSSRALIPLIDFDMVFKSGDGFLPSFDLVQFGFMKEERTHLYIFLYLRALETKHFLPINLCEIYLMCNEIVNEIRSIATIDLSVYAFKAQYKESFGCFKRAEIDTLKEAEITMLLRDNAHSIINLLEDKRLLSETVIEDKGMISLYNALVAANDRTAVQASIMILSKDILNTMSTLKAEREKTSNYSSIEVLEQQLETEFDQLINLFKDGDIYESK